MAVWLDQQEIRLTSASVEVEVELMLSLKIESSDDMYFLYLHSK